MDSNNQQVQQQSNKKEEEIKLIDLQLELLKMNIKREQGLSAADAGKYRILKKKVARIKSQLK
jgi:ribosomal protein L29